MKKLIYVALCCTFFITAQATTNTNEIVSFTYAKAYLFPVALPNDAVSTSFPLARDKLMNGLSVLGRLSVGGTAIASGSRQQNGPTSLEIKSVFDAGDAMVLNTNSNTNALYRGYIIPKTGSSDGTNQLGHRIYCTILIVAEGTNKLRLRDLSGSASDENGFIHTSSDLVNTNYSVSRIGLIKDQYGDIFGDGREIINSGPNTQEVDAIIFLGERVAVSVSSQTAINDFNAYIGTGDKITFSYTYHWYTNGVTNAVVFSKDVMMYQLGQIPSSSYGQEFIPTPVGRLYSMVQPETNTYTVWSSSVCDGGYTLVTTNATTGFSWNWKFRNTATNDMGYLKIFNNTVPRPPD